MTPHRPARLHLEMATSAEQERTLAVRSPVSRADLPGLVDRVCALLRHGETSVVRCDVAGVEPNMVAVDALAQLQLAARRHGCTIRLCNASQDLRELVALMGLEDVLVG